MKTINILDPQQVSAEDSIKLHELAKYIYKAKKTTMLTGAGISCNAGIPDFRSDDGLYNIVKAKYPSSFIKGQDLFDISLFRSNETLLIFCTFMEGLYKFSLQAKATETHKFINTLKEKNKLLRCYTQNIDSLEKKPQPQLRYRLCKIQRNRARSGTLIPGKLEGFRRGTITRKSPQTFLYAVPHTLRMDAGASK